MWNALSAKGSRTARVTAARMIICAKYVPFEGFLMAGILSVQGAQSQWPKSHAVFLAGRFDFCFFWKENKI
ncbi:MAG: hypothetical protein A2052_05520 [Deltaproteobacteria bacterium GWA2_54_12]|nr:MAG: hypothetical protein A2052_05520 [Deltaproteobacteria bacterium GWA2_54_12]